MSKEKATELINKFFLPLEESLNANINTKRKEIAKKYALIYVDGVLENFNLIHKPEDTMIFINGVFVDLYEANDYWHEVKHEIENL